MQVLDPVDARVFSIYGLTTLLVFSFRMKRSMPSPSCGVVVKRKKNFSLSNMPDHHYHLGDGKFVVVCRFYDALKIHLRDYKCDDENLYYPTRSGIVIDPYSWEMFSSEINSFNPCDAKRIKIFNRKLFLSSDGEVVRIQVLGVVQGVFNLFPSVFQMNMEQWEKLCSFKDSITASFHQMLFGDKFREEIFRSLSSLNPELCGGDTSIEDEDGVMCLTTNLIDTVKVNVQKAISEHLTDECMGCKQELGNQLGHECVTNTASYNVFKYFNRALAQMVISDVANQFVIENVHLCKYLTIEFLASIDVQQLLKAAIKGYTSDHFNQDGHL